MNRVIVENQCLTELKQVSSDKLEEVLSFLRDLNQNTHFAQNNQNTSSDSVDALKMLLDMSQPTDFTDLASVGCISKASYTFISDLFMKSCKIANVAVVAA